MRVWSVAEVCRVWAHVLERRASVVGVACVGNNRTPDFFQRWRERKRAATEYPRKRARSSGNSHSTCSCRWKLSHDSVQATMVSKLLVLGPLLLFIFVIGSYYYYSNDYFHYGLQNSVMHRALRIVVHAEASLIEECKSPPAPREINNVSEWQEIAPGNMWFVYSAFLDRRLNPPLVRIIALAKEGGASASFFCQMWTRGGIFSATPIHKQELWVYAWDRAKPGEYYHPYLLSCPSPKGHPITVAIAAGNPCKPATNIIRVHGVSLSPPQSFAICLKPLRFARDIETRFVEWLELQFLLGVEKIFVEVGSVPQKTWEVLHHYQALGKMILRNYTAPPGNSTLLWQRRRHEMAFYNDCFYRHLESHQFVVNLDLDEALVPVMSDTWAELLSPATKRSPSASLSARCTYFFDAMGMDPSVPPYLHMLSHVYRSSALAPPGFAQKSFFSTKYVESVSNHFALRSVRPDIRLLSELDPRQEARLHHYRKECPALMEQECSQKYLKFRERDTLLWKFKEKLTTIVLKRMQQLGLHSIHII